MPTERAWHVLARRIACGAFRDARENGGLGQCELANALAEVVFARLFDAVSTVTEIDVVEVELEDLVLRKLLLDAPREKNFLHFALVRALVGEEDVLDDLLGDGAAALA